MDSRFRGNDDYQGVHRIHVIPANAGIHFSRLRSVCHDFDVALGAGRVQGRDESPDS